jgi:hypothetical protein
VVIAGKVADKKFLGNAGFAMGGAIVIVLTALLVLRDDAAEHLIPLTDASNHCALSPSFVQGIQGMMVEWNTSCLYDQTIDSVLRL